MSRLLYTQSLVYDQLDFLSGMSRISVNISFLSLKLFVNNQSLPWILEDGSNIVDSTIASSKVYYNEISGNPGYNSIRFYPDRVGFWRLIFSWSGGEIVKEYDITGVKNSSGGLNASFFG